MDSKLFDRIAKRLAGQGPRRDAVKVFAAGGMAAITGRLLPGDAEAKKKKKKKRCRKFGQTCGGKNKCCKKKGPASCQPFHSFLCVGVELTGRRCCGLEGAVCDPNFGTPVDVSPISGGNCSCCEPLFCGKQPNGTYRCQVEDT